MSCPTTSLNFEIQVRLKTVHKVNTSFLCGNSKIYMIIDYVGYIFHKVDVTLSLYLF